MCYAKPGPRCSYHIKKSVNLLKQQYEKTPQGNVEQRENILKKIKDEQLQYYGTTEGLKKLLQIKNKALSTKELSKADRVQKLINSVIQRKAESYYLYYQKFSPDKNISYEECLNKQYNKLNSLNSKISSSFEGKIENNKIENSNFSYDQEIVDKIGPLHKPPKIGEATSIVEIIKECSAATGLKMNSKVTLHSTASRIGHVLENVFVEKMRNDGCKAYTGSSVLNKISSARKGVDRQEIFNFLRNDLHMDATYVETIIDSKNSVNLPDIIVVNDKEYPPVIKVSENKASGINDNSSITQNINKMTAGAPNSTVNQWNDGIRNGEISLQKAIYITAAKEDVIKRGTYSGKHKAASNWLHHIEKNNINDIDVIVNEEGFQWFTGKKKTYKEYKEQILNTSVMIELMSHNRKVE